MEITWTNSTPIPIKMMIIIKIVIKILKNNETKAKYENKNEAEKKDYNEGVTIENE